MQSNFNQEVIWILPFPLHDLDRICQQYSWNLWVNKGALDRFLWGEKCDMFLVAKRTIILWKTKIYKKSIISFTNVLHIPEVYSVIIFLLNASNCLTCYVLLSWFLLGLSLDPKILTKCNCSVFRCYLAISVQS